MPSTDTIITDGETYKLHHIPSGILSPGTACVIGAGCVIDPETFVRDGWLRFKLSDADYLQLAGEGLSAIVTVDREAAQILGVKFRHRR